MLPPVLALAWWTGDLEAAYEFEDWQDFWFSFMFFLSCVFGFILMLSMTLCTQFNSPLTTTVVGSLKNIAVTYLGKPFDDSVAECVLKRPSRSAIQ